MINKKTDDLAIAWVNKNKDFLIEKWIEFSKIPSIKSEAKDGAPFGVHCAEALNYAASLFNDEGIFCEVDKQGGYAVAELGKKRKTIGLFSHSDVVPVGDDWIYTKPFEPKIIDGALIGRGVEDNKSGVMHAFCIFKFLKDNGIELKNRLQTFIGSDEECGMQDMDAFLKKHQIPEISVVPDADFPCSVGEKGIYHFWAECEKAFETVLDFCGGQAFNIVLDNAKVVLKYNADVEAELIKKIKSNDKFSLMIDDEKIILSAKGVAKHASIPEGSLNAAVLLCDILSACETVNKNDREIFTSIRDIIISYYGEGIGVVHTDKNFGKLTSVNGIVKLAEFKPCVSFDVRYGSTLSPEYLVAESTSALKKKGFIVKNSDNSPGFSIDDESIVPAIFENIYAQIVGEKLPSVRMSGGTYARRLKNAFSVGTSAFPKSRTNPVFEMPEGHGGAHQCDEMIDIEGFFDAFRIMLQYVLACDNIL